VAGCGEHGSEALGSIKGVDLFWPSACFNFA
jgi:hypothetical protein